jgi:hypothetical protein
MAAEKVRGKRKFVRLVSTLPGDFHIRSDSNRRHFGDSVNLAPPQRILWARLPWDRDAGA